MIYVPQEFVEGIDTLHKTFLKTVPCLAVYDSRYGVKWEELLLECVVLVNAKAHSEALHPPVHCVTAFCQRAD